MAARKYYYRFIPVSQYDIAGLESWLAAMAEKGLFLFDFGAYSGKFTKDAPKSARYRLEPVGKDKDYPGSALKDLYEEAGWRYITTYKKLFHIFLPTTPRRRSFIPTLSSKAKRSKSSRVSCAG